jgi:hypothetical protein
MDKFVNTRFDQNKARLEAKLHWRGLDDAKLHWCGLDDAEDAEEDISDLAEEIPQVSSATSVRLRYSHVLPLVPVSEGPADVMHCLRCSGMEALFAIADKR